MERTAFYWKKHQVNVSKQQLCGLAELHNFITMDIAVVHLLTDLI